MSPWIALLLGIIIGWIFGIIIARQNYETCRKQIERMKEELGVQETEIKTAQDAIDHLRKDLKEKDEELSAAHANR